MTHRISNLLACSTLLFAACGGAAPTPAEATDAEPAAGAATIEAAGGTSEQATPNDSAPTATDGSSAGTATASVPSAPKPPAPKTRMEHCQLLGPAMQQVQQVGPIANAGDGAKLREMASALRREAEPLAKAELSHKELGALRDAYVATTNDMATALEQAAATQNANEQKAAVERFRKLEPKLGDHLEQLNTICNAPGK